MGGNKVGFYLVQTDLNLVLIEQVVFLFLIAIWDEEDHFIKSRPCPEKSTQATSNLVLERV